MQLTTPRLQLREFEEADWEAVLAYQSDPRYLRYYPWTERTEPDVRQFVDEFVQDRYVALRRRFQLAVTLRESGTLIGNCGIRITDPEQREGSLGYELDPRCWGNGYATEAARQMVRFAFTELRLQRVWATCVAENLASARVLERLGMRLDETFQMKEYFKGRWWEQRRIAILEHKRR